MHIHLVLTRVPRFPRGFPFYWRVEKELSLLSRICVCICPHQPIQLGAAAQAVPWCTSQPNGAWRQRIGLRAGSYSRLPFRPGSALVSLQGATGGRIVLAYGCVLLRMIGNQIIGNHKTSGSDLLLNRETLHTALIIHLGFCVFIVLKSIIPNSNLSSGPLRLLRGLEKQGGDITRH